MIDADRMAGLVTRELALIENPERREALRRLLVPPRLEERDWEYGAPGERYPFWVIAEAPDLGITLAYCEQGFGPESPWGFLVTDERETATLGMDSQWNWYLEEAFVRSGLWKGPVKPGFEEAFHRPPEERFGGGGTRDA
jgi:hypothetical protein